MGFTIFIIVIRHTMLATIERAFFARVSFLPFHGIFSRSCVIWSYATFSVYMHSSKSIILGYGAVMVLGGRQSDETVRFGFPWADFEC